MVRVQSRNHQNKKATNRCPVCSHNHRLVFCRELRRMEAAERLRAVLVHHHCANCLSPHHTAKTCQSPKSCDRCQQRHHSLLHLGEQGRDGGDESIVLDNDTTTRRKRQPYTAKALEESSEDEEVLILDADETDLHSPMTEAPALVTSPIPRPTLSRIRSTVQKAPTRAGDNRGKHGTWHRQQQQQRRRMRDARERVTGSAHTALGQSVLTPTVAVKVMTEGHVSHVRAIVDPGQGTSTISRALAHRLRVLHRGDKSCRLVLKGWHERLEVQALITPTLNRITPERTLDARIRSEFDNIRLADPSFYRSSNVSLVLGAEVYAAILRPGLMAATPTRPAAQNTMFGWMLSGSTPF
ncbi:unnamed protein product [Ceratitis capitata]|uniref:(Mediterranean fruit fly) hypothetical protein n=1 Tax=Ceratitis capitata TaxID=7213 RepID=A0A811UH07_CERCA|nr:unnamed protein product [Ceratitis capitata]